MSTPGTDGLIEVYSGSTGRRQRVPADWVGDPVLGKDLVPTPAQLVLDGTLGPIPGEDLTVNEIKAYADGAGIDTGKASTKVKLIEAIAVAFAPGPFQSGVVLEPLVDEPPAESEVPGGEPDTPTPAGDGNGIQE